MKLILSILMICVIANSVSSNVYRKYWEKPEKVISTADIDGQYKFYNDTIYLLNGFVYVEDGEILSIEAGTIIKGKGAGAVPEQGLTDVNASALIVSQGGKIYALGTKYEPIAFTALVDDIATPFDLDKTNKGLWGGVILLGNAPICEGQSFLEGFPETDANKYGGQDPLDNSGVLEYVTIRHGGFALFPDKEINGLTMGGVGAGTKIDYVEVFANADDGFEWFGGTVRPTHLVSAFNHDDAFDWDECFTGGGQFWFALLDEGDGNYCGELSGSAAPGSTPKLYNVTFLGDPTDANDQIIRSKDNQQTNVSTGAFILNSLFGDNGGAEERVDAGSQSFADPANPSSQLWFVGSPSGAPYDNTNPNLFNISRIADCGLDPRPDKNGEALNQERVQVVQPGFVQANYLGAFNHSEDPNALWILYWTTLDLYRHVSYFVITPGKPGFMGRHMQLSTDVAFHSSLQVYSPVATLNNTTYGLYLQNWGKIPRVATTQNTTVAPGPVGINIISNKITAFSIPLRNNTANPVPLWLDAKRIYAEGIINKNGQLGIYNDVEVYEFHP
jgi:hypothetical protein